MSKLFSPIRLVFFLFLFGIGFWGCSIYDPPVKVPSFISIDTFSFSTDPAVHGFNTQSITEAWIFVNGKTLGAYSIPTQKIPVLVEGNAQIAIGAGVFADGVKGNKVLYPFYQQYQTEAIFEKEKTISLKPQFSYKDDIKIPFVYYQDFEKSDSGFTKGKFGTVNLERPVNPDGSNQKFGNRFGRLRTQNDLDVIQYSNNVYLPLRQNGMPVYLEFDYQSTCELAVGIMGQSTQTEYFDLVLRPVAEWTKIYVSLSDEAEAFNNGETFRFFIRSTATPGIGNTLLLDNIRLIHY